MKVTAVKIIEQTPTVIVGTPGIQGPPGPPGRDAGNAVFIKDFFPTSGQVKNRVWVTPDRHIASAVTDSPSVVVQALLEGSSEEYKPTATINGVEATVTETTTLRVFLAEATVPLVVGENQIVVVSSTGASDEAVVTRMAQGPSITGFSIPTPTAPQTHYYQGQTIPVTIFTESSAVQVKILAGGACASEVILPVASGVATGSFIASSASTSSITAVAYNDFGTPGMYATSPSVPLDQVAPSISLNVSYPNSQYAVKQGQTCVLSTSAANFTSVDYSFPEGLTGSNGYEAEKTLTCTGDQTGLFTITATAYKASNNTTCVTSLQVRLANTSPTLALSVQGNPSQLRRSPSGNAYILQLSSDQPLMSASCNVTTLTPNSTRLLWTGTLLVSDSTPTGPLSITFSVAGAAGHPESASMSPVVGGFTSRVVTWPAFSRVAPLGLAVFNEDNVRLTIGTKQLSLQKSTIDQPDHFFIAREDGAYDPQGSYIGLSDVAFAMSNTTGTLQGTVEEL
jgi:hypothetical protein